MTAGPHRRAFARPSDVVAMQRSLLLALSPLPLGLAGLAVLGWAIDAPALAGLADNGATMKMNTAVALICAGLSVLLILVGRGGRASVLLASLCAVIGGATLFQHLTGIDLHIDLLLHRDQGGEPPGRMAPTVSLALLLLGAGLAMIGRGIARNAAILALTGSTAIAALSVFGYVYGAAALYDIPSYSTVAAPTALALLAASLCGLSRLLPDDNLRWVHDPGLRAIAIGVLTVIAAGAVLARLAGADAIPPPLAIFLCIAMAVALLLFAFRESFRATRRHIAELSASNLHLAHLTGEIADREARLRLALDAARMGDWQWDAGSDRIILSERAAEIFGVPAGSSWTWTELQGLIHSEDRERVQDEIRHALTRRGAYELEYRVLRPADGVEVWILAAGRGLYDKAGAPSGTIGVVTDVTQMHQAQESERLLAREIDHRARNVLAVAQAVVRLTPFESQRQYVAAVSERISAIARAHTLLANNRWTGVPLDELVRRELEPYAKGDRLTLDGPAIELKPVAVQPFTVLLHELAADAAKLGSLSGPQGTLAVRWTVDPDGDLSITWAEQGGPDDRTSASDGFGAALVSGSVRQLGGRMERDPRPDGLHVTLSVPADRFAARRRAGEPERAPAPAGPAAAIRGARILVVEDEPLLALEVRDTLEAAGCVVLGPAFSVTQALTLLQAEKPDFAVLDVNLGGETSVPVAAELERLGAGFVFVTGYQKPEIVAGRVLQKPVAANDLLALVGQEIGRRTAR